MKQNPYAGLKKVILASMILVPLVPFVLVLSVGYYYFTYSLENNTIAGIQRIVKDHRQMIESLYFSASARYPILLLPLPRYIKAVNGSSAPPLTARFLMTW